MSKTPKLANVPSSVVPALLKSMDTNPGFAGLGDAVVRVCNLVDGDGDNSEIAAVIMRDAALTAKVLQLSNSARFARGGSNITTIDKAVAILGLNNVKSVALSLSLLKSISNKSQSNQVHAEIVAGFFAGTLAAAITRGNSTFSAAEAQVCGLLQNLGRIMLTYHDFEAIQRSRKLQNEQNITQNEAVLQTLGVSFDEIGASIAQHWNLPDSLQNALAPDTTMLPPSAAAADIMSWLQMCSLFCRRTTEVLFRLPENQQSIGLSDQISFFQKSLKLNERSTLELINKCLLETDEILASMNFPGNVGEARSVLRKSSERAMDLLSSQDTLTKEMKDGSGQSPIETVKHYMRLIHDHCHFDSTVICLPSGSAGLQVIAGVGKNVSSVAMKIRGVGMKKDIFQAVMSRKADVFIGDLDNTPYAALIPAWYSESVSAQSFVLLSLASEDKLVALIYCDYAKPVATLAPEVKDESMKEWRAKLLEVLKYGSKGKPEPA